MQPIFRATCWDGFGIRREPTLNSLRRLAPIGLPLQKGPVFIVGAPRSGTTLLQYILRTHPALSMPTGESHFFIPLMRNEGSYGDLSRPENVRKVLEAMYRQSAEFLDTDLHGLKFDITALTDELVRQGRRTMRDLISGLFEANAAGEGKERWGDKTPYYVLHMGVLLNWWPDAQFIHIVRDGRDVALSLFARQHDFGVYNTYFAARYWSQYVETGHEQGALMPVGRYLEMRYEDLLTDQRATLIKVCSFLGIDFVESLMDHKRAGRAGKTPLLQKSVQKDNAEKWRAAMTPAQIRAFEGGAADALRHHGYPLISSGARLPLPARALYQWHNRMTAAYYRWRQSAKG